MEDYSMIRAKAALDGGLPAGEIDDRLYGSFIEHLGRAIYGGIYEPGHPRADKDGFRSDVLELVKELRVPLIRYPGGNYASAYNWEDGVGPAAARKVRLDLAWRSTEPNSVGIGEFSRWARKAGSEVMMAVNLGTRGIEDARNVVEYCNHPGGSYFSDLRRSHGDADPYGFKIWCLGNELDGPWQVGCKTAEEYGKLAREVGKALKLFDPKLELVACGSSGPGMPTFPHWEATVLEFCQEQVDYLSLHTYARKSGGDTATFLGESVQFESFIGTVESTVEFARAKARSKKKIKLSVDEWNVWYHTIDADAKNEPWAIGPHLLEDAYTMEDALVVGAFLIVLMRRSESVRIGCLAQLVNTIAPIMTENGGAAWRQTIFYPFLHASLYGRGRLIPLKIDSPAYENEKHGSVPFLDAAAVLSMDESQATVFCLNRSPDQKAEFELRLGGFSSLSLIEHIVLSNSDPLAINDAASPGRVAPRRGTAALDGERLKVVLEPYSWNVLRLSVKK
jgi:alpha-L-arabinofuranosidase